jgi:hypothetical protein
VSLLEKAFAKINESYDNINGGIGTQGLYAITGAPTKEYYIDQTPDII